MRRRGARRAIATAAGGGRRPFAQLPFADVPEAPRVPHGYAASEARTVPVASAPFGPVDVHVRVLGAGPPLLLVHGFMTSSYSFRYVLAPLAERFTVYAPDLPGAGRSSKPDRSYAPERLATFLGELVDALGIRGAACVGNSLGGYLCMRLALADPGALGRLVNLHSPGAPTGRLWALQLALRATPRADAIVRRLVWRDPERWVHKNVHYWDETLKSKEEHREYAAPLRSPDGVRAFYRMLAETMDPSAMSAFVKELARLDGRFPIPLQLLYAKEDPMVPPIVGDRLRALLPTAEYARLERGSHFAHVDAPDLFLALALPFLTAADAPRSEA